MGSPLVRFGQRQIRSVSTQLEAQTAPKPLPEAFQTPAPAGYQPAKHPGLPRVGRSQPIRDAVEIPRREGSYGVVADFDQTIAPAHDGDAIPRPFPGIAALIHELQGAQTKPSPEAGYTHYVTARQPELTRTLPAYLAQHGLPSPENLHIGLSTTLDETMARKKISDISGLMERDPGRGFVLFGDSSHIDPMVYQAVQARFPEKVVAAIIHRVKDNVPPAGYAGLIVVDDYVDAALALHAAGALSKEATLRVAECAQIEGLELRAVQKHRLSVL